MTDASGFDPSALEGVSAVGDGLVLHRLLEQFEADHHASVRRIGEALGAGRLEAARRDARALGTSSAFVGLVGVAAAAERIEREPVGSDAHHALVEAMALGLAAFRRFVANPRPVGRVRDPRARCGL